MLSLKKRLNLKKDFKWVVSGRSLETRYAKLFFKDGVNGFPRIGIATSAKVFKKASDRNRARRLISVIFEQLYPLLPSNINIVALPKATILGVKSDEVLDDVKRSLKEANFLKAD